MNKHIQCKGEMAVITPSIGNLSEIEITGVDRIEAAADAAMRIFFDKTLGLIPGIGALINFTHEYDNEIEKRKLEILLENFQQRHTSIEVSVDKMNTLLRSGSGFILFRKVMALVGDGPPEPEYLALLANTLKRIVDTDFTTLFLDHSYVLYQMDKLTPYALILLADNAKWPKIDFASTTTSGVTNGQGWDMSFASKYCEYKGLSEHMAKLRICHVINELRNNNICELQPNALSLTMIGAELTSYICPA